MPYVSHRTAAGRTFDCLYDPTYTVPSEKDALQASKSALSNGTTVNVYPKYHVMFEDAPKATRMLYRKTLNDLPCQRDTPVSVEMVQGVGRLVGGANYPPKCKASKSSLSASELRRKAGDLFYFKSPTNVNVINVKLSDSQTKQTDVHNECRRFHELSKRKRITTRGTQTLYRESSAQTLPYLPDVSNVDYDLEYLELFKLPSLLPGDGPPGQYEMEMLERARKRWAFKQALKENFQRQLDAAKENVQTVKLPEHENILHAFEYEQWIEREEYIQERQMLRLELVIRMFEKREREMYKSSNARIEQSLTRIAAAREAQLQKNEMQYGRQLRRLEWKQRREPRNWRKENITKELGNPSSEFYAPQMRYGVNPKRGHFQCSKAFEARMDDLDKRAVNMNNLVCPFAKLNRWSTPKERLTEVEQKFCTSENLKSLYESLRGLREQYVQHKITPKCLIEKQKRKSNVPRVKRITVERSTQSRELKVAVSVNAEPDEISPQRFDDMQRETSEQRQPLVQQYSDSRQEELEAVMNEYEGCTIGWILQFLSEEMTRLQQQRKLHFLTHLAQKERWRREAAEAGLRQKENDLRAVYERLYQATHPATRETCNKFLDNIFTLDMRELADDKAKKHITDLAKTIDQDIQRWLHSFEGVQNPLNFDTLRHVLKDLIFPNAADAAKRYESKQMAAYIIDEVLFPQVEKLLEPYDICHSTVNDAIDRLLDNDLFIFTPPDCDSDCNSECKCSVQQREASAILRKLIRYGVPGRRWRTPTERIADENAADILNDVFDAMQEKGFLNEPECIDNGLLPSSSQPQTDKDENTIAHKNSSTSLRTSEESFICSSFISAFPDGVERPTYQMERFNKHVEFGHTYASFASNPTLQGFKSKFEMNSTSSNMPLEEYDEYDEDDQFDLVMDSTQMDLMEKMNFANDTERSNFIRNLLQKGIATCVPKIKPVDSEHSEIEFEEPRGEESIHTFEYDDSIQQEDELLIESTDDMEEYISNEIGATEEEMYEHDASQNFYIATTSIEQFDDEEDDDVPGISPETKEAGQNFDSYDCNKATTSNVSFQ